MNKKLIALFLLSCFICAGLTAFASAETLDENLAAGLTYTIETGEPISLSYANYIKDGDIFEIDGGQLTDSNVAPLDETSGAWYRAYRGRSRIVSFDLGSVCAVSCIEAGFLHSKNSQIYAPRYVNVWLSENGTDYDLVAEYETNYEINSSALSRYNAIITLEEIFAARYVKIEYDCDFYSYCDEIRVIGGRTLSGSEAKLRPDTAEEPEGYKTSLGNASNIVKLYSGFTASDKTTVLTEEILLPYVAYIDQNGEIAGTMFDAAVFAPINSVCPSGGMLSGTIGGKGAVMSDWELYFESVFKEGQNLDSLDKTVGNVYGELTLKGKYKVFLTIPYPAVVADKPFGDIDGDGLDEYCRTLEERTDVIEWFVKKYIAEFKSKRYENLELAGFYWYSDSINYSESDHEAELVTAMNQCVRREGLLSLWSASYLASGFDEWEKYGFKGAVMQPNAAFEVSDDEYYFNIAMLEEFAQTVYNNNLGVEIETDKLSSFQGDDYLTAGYNYESYLWYGGKTGYINSLKTYEQDVGAGTFYNFCYADMSTPKGIYLRRLYDITFSFIHRVYANEAPLVTVEQEIELVYGDQTVNIDIEITDSDSHWDNIKIEFPTAPQHGKVAAAAGNKTVIYSPDEGYLGEDSFTVRVTDGFNFSAAIPVTVTVTSAEIPSGVDIEQSFDNSANIGEPAREDVPVWLIILLAVLGSAIIIAPVIMIIKHKKAK